jgi:RimJ/RimL family protein N-acetyltransferase/nucleotide-binding universal stress UspA family protein
MAPAGDHVAVQLSDGARVLVRPIEPEDRDALAAGFERLSPESRYRRFFAPVPRLRKRDLDYLTRVDHHDHEALVAFGEGTDHIVGVARFVRTSDEEAEPAITVTDDWQGRGLAGHLLDALVERAREEGVRRFVAPVLADNRAAIAVMERLGETSRRDLGREVELSITLPHPGDRSPVLVQLLQGWASGALEPARTIWDRVTWRRRPATADPANAIVVGMDGADGDAEAVRCAGRLAALSGARVHVVGSHRLLLGDREEVGELVTGSVEELRADGVDAAAHVHRGDQAEALLDVAGQERARLIVLGPRRVGSSGALLSGTADEVAHRAPCDVLLYRDRGG